MKKINCLNLLLSLLIFSCLVVGCNKKEKTQEGTDPKEPVKVTPTDNSVSEIDKELLAQINAWTSSSKPLLSDAKAKELLGKHSCYTCHSLDGSQMIGPTLKGIFGKKGKVIRGDKEVEITVDELYLLKSLLHPMEEITSGYAPMMPPANLTDEEARNIVEFMKRLK